MIPHWLIWLYNMVFIALDGKGIPWQIAADTALSIVLGFSVAWRVATGE